MSLTNLGDDVHNLFVNIVDGGSIAVVVDINFDQSLRVLAQSDKHPR